MERLERALPALTDLKNLYERLGLNGKQTLLKRVFEGGLIYDGQLLRTPRLHPALMHNYVRIKEKRLLFVEQPEDFSSNSEGCTVYGIRTPADISYLFSSS